MDALSRSVFSDASRWKDATSEKISRKSPDTKQKYNAESVWPDNVRAPWVAPTMASKLVLIAPDPTQLSKKGVREPVDSKARLEKLWRSFFADPSQWWDNRPEKYNPKFPDFKHKRTNESLWLVNSLNPQWVASELASIAPGILQMHTFSWTKKLSRSNKAKQYASTMELYEQMKQQGISADHFVFVPVLNACAGLRNLKEGQRIHAQVIQTGCELHLFVSNALIDMYAKCGSIDDARAVFNKMPERTVVAWTAIIRGYVNCGQGLKALEMFQEMQQDGVEPDAITFVSVLNACISIASLDKGRQVHEQIRQSGCEVNAYLASSLVTMYAKCGSIEDAWKVFNKMPKHDVVTWNAMIWGHVNDGQGLKALEVFQRMELEGIQPDSVTFVGLLKVFTSIRALAEGRHVHEQIVQNGFELDGNVADSLMEMYVQCGSLDDALLVFKKIPTREVAAWNAIILGHANCGQGLKALELFQQMQQEEVEPDSATYLGLLSACASIAALDEGRLVHQQIIQSGYEKIAQVRSSLVDMYAKCGSLEDALAVFNNTPKT